MTLSRLTHRIGRIIGQIIRWLLLLAALGLVGLSLLPLSGSEAWWVRYAEYPALQIGAAMVVVAVLLMFWRGRLDWIAVAGLLGGIAVQADRLAPYLAPAVLSRPSPTVPGGSCTAPDRVRIVAVNVERTNRHSHALLNMVRDLKPDVVWAQEVDGWWDDELSALKTDLPYGVADVRENYFGVHLYSKLKLDDTSVQELTSSNAPSVFATATLASGRRFRLYALHPHPPQIGQGTAERDAQLAATALAAHDDTVPHIVLGDLNAVPWAGTLAMLEKIGQVEDPRVGRGLFITWNAERTLAKWPLDHILPSPDLVLSTLRVLPAFGSDHLPLLADFCVTAGFGVPKSLDPALRAEAEAIVARGQGKALGIDVPRP